MIRRIGFGCLISVLAMVLAMVIYISIYYHATQQVMDQIEQECSEGRENYKVIQCENGDVILEPASSKAGIIFYPGGKVQMEAYYPLMQQLAENGYLCVLLDLTGRLAVLEQNAADGYIERYQDVSDWYLAGHSLGGWVASGYIKEKAADYQGLILLASYSTADLSETDLSVLSIYGSQDGVMNRELYEKSKANLPHFNEHIIEGGCHAYFGAYGKQRGDGEATITPAEQVEETVQLIDAFIEENNH